MEIDGNRQNTGKDIKRFLVHRLFPLGFRLSKAGRSVHSSSAMSTSNLQFNDIDKFQFFLPWQVASFYFIRVTHVFVYGVYGVYGLLLCPWI